jgi:hypothetical protein
MKKSQAVRITSADGKAIFEQIPEAVKGYEWPDQVHAKMKPSETLLVTISHPARDQQLLAGCQVLDDGNLLWFGRTDAEESRLRGAHSQSSLARRTGVDGLHAAADVVVHAPCAYAGQ